MQGNDITTLYELIFSRIRNEPDKVAIFAHDSEITYQELGERVDNLASGLMEIGVGEGDHVGVVLPNCPEYLYCLLALLRLRAVMVPIHVQCGEQETHFLLEHSDASSVIATVSYRGRNRTAEMSQMMGKLPKLRNIISDVECADTDYYLSDLICERKGSLPAEAPEPEDTSLILYTTGTTGAPKGVMLSERNILAGAKAIREIGEIEEWNVWLLIAPLSSSVLIPSIGLIGWGASIVLLDDFAPSSIFATIERYKVTNFFAPSSMYQILLSVPEIGTYDLSSVHCIGTGMDFLSPDLPKEIRDHFRRTYLSNGYGLTETSAMAMAWKSWRDIPKPTTEQLVLATAGNEVEVMDENGRIVEKLEQGEVVIRGPSVMKGYYKAPDETQKVIDKEGWFHTGDLAVKCENGAIRLSGRAKEIIKRGGRSIFPVEIEEFLSSYEGVGRAAVIGVPHPNYGEMTCAFVEPKPGYELTEGELRTYCRGKIAAHKIPDEIRILPKLPLLPIGNKVDKIRLQQIVKESQRNS